MNQTKQFKLVTFYIAGKAYGINLEIVQEFIEYIDYTALPIVRNNIVGVVNLRGRIITVSDMGLLFDNTACQEKKLLMVMRPNFNIKGNKSKTPIAFIVDNNGAILEVNDEDLVDIPDFKDSDSHHLCSHAIKTPDGMLAVINPEKLYLSLKDEVE